MAFLLVNQLSQVSAFRLLCLNCFENDRANTNFVFWKRVVDELCNERAMEEKLQKFLLFMSNCQVS
jgi:hypothetical protein